MGDYWQDIPLPTRFRNLLAVLVDYWPALVLFWPLIPAPPGYEYWLGFAVNSLWVYLALAVGLAWLTLGAVMTARGRTQSLGQYLTGIRVCRPVRDPQGKSCMAYPGFARTALAVAVDSLLCGLVPFVPIGKLTPLVVLFTKRHQTPGQLLANVLPIDKRKAAEHVGDTEWLVNAPRDAR